MERKPRLEGKVVIVTGAGSQLDEGIGSGRAAAVLMAREGARVLNSRQCEPSMRGRSGGRRVRASGPSVAHNPRMQPQTRYMKTSDDGRIAFRDSAFSGGGEFVMNGFDDAARLNEVRWRT